MKKEMSFLRSGTFRVWLVCYLLVLCIPLAFSTVVQHNMYGRMQEKIYAQSTAAVEQFSSTADEQWRTIFRISDAICSSSQIFKLRYISLPYNGARFYEVHNRAAVLADYSASSTLISGLYLYSANLDSLLDAGHIYQQGVQMDSAARKYLDL